MMQTSKIGCEVIEVAFGSTNTGMAYVHQSNPHP
jgi:hypothetical protein